MSVKVIAMIQDFNFDGGNLYLHCKVEDSSNSAEGVQFGAFSPDSDEVTVNADLKALVKSYAINQWGTSFGPLDKVRLIHQVSVF